MKRFYFVKIYPECARIELHEILEREVAGPLYPPIPMAYQQPSPFPAPPSEVQQQPPCAVARCDTRDEAKRWVVEYIRERIAQLQRQLEGFPQEIERLEAQDKEIRELW